MRPLLCFALSLVFASFSSASAIQTRIAKADLDRAIALERGKDFSGAIRAVKKAVQEDPELTTAHDEFVQLMFRFVDESDPNWIKEEKADAAAVASGRPQYDIWLKMFPRSAGVEYGLGALYLNCENPHARPFLLKAVALNPNLAVAWAALSEDAERWGNEKEAHEDLGKAAAVDPENPEYAYDYAYYFENIDPAKYVSMSLEVAKRFPSSETGARSLYWLGEHSTSDEDKIKYWEQDRAQFAPNKFGWSAGAMTLLFDVYLRTAPEKALALSQQMNSWVTGEDATEWSNNERLAQNVIEIRKLMDSRQFSEAKTLLDSSKIGKYSKDAEMFELLKAEVTAGSGDPKGAYDTLLAKYAKTPEDAIHQAILKYGADLSKTPDQVESDVWALRNAAAKPAPPFDLRDYLTGGKESLADYRGKVVLLTFWFPGCGPCRGEFPHFENVLKKFKGQPVDYVGINVWMAQSDYVKSFMKRTRFSFTPLKSEGTENDYKVRGCPTNFLIDQTGRIVYTGFMIEDLNNERMLQLMIQSLLDRKEAN